MRKPITLAELEALADRVGATVETVARWHIRHGRHNPHRNAGRPKGKAKRPKGTIAVRDIVRRHGIKVTTLAKWREQGLPFQRIGSMIVIREADLRRWIRERGRRDNKPPQGPQTMRSKKAIPRFGERIPNVFYHPRQGAYGVFIDDQQRFATLKVKGSYFLPGGGMEAAESPQQALRRKVQHECGWTIRVGSEIGAVVEYIWAAEERKGYEVRAHFFRCTVSVQSGASIECDHSLVWFSVSDAAKCLHRQSQASAIEQAFSNYPRHAGRRP